MVLQLNRALRANTVMRRNQSGIPRRGLVARWRLGNGDPNNYLDPGTYQQVRDLSGNGNTLQVGSTTGVDSNDPVIGTLGATADGVDDMMVSAGVVSAGPGRSIITIFADSSAEEGSTKLLAAYGATATYQGLSSAKQILLSEMFVSTQETFSPANYVVNAPVFVGSVRATDRFDAYVAGTKSSMSVTGAINQMTFTHLFNFGGLGSVPSATLYEVLLYNVALTDAEMQQAYRAAKSYWAGKGLAL